MFLLLQSGDLSRVMSIRKQPGSYVVFNLMVEGCHTYFVGSAGILVHNRRRGILSATALPGCRNK